MEAKEGYPKMDTDGYVELIAAIKKYNAAADDLEVLKSKIAAMEQAKHNAAQALDEALKWVGLTRSVLERVSNSSPVTFAGK